MKKSEAERLIRHLCQMWLSEHSINLDDQAGFSAFVDWLIGKGYSHALHFKSRVVPLQDVQSWFRDEIAGH